MKKLLSLLLLAVISTSTIFASCDQKQNEKKFKYEGSVSPSFLFMGYSIHTSHGIRFLKENV